MAGILDAIGRALSNAIGTVKKNQSDTSAYKGTKQNYSDTVNVALPNGSVNYSQQKADAKNATAWIPGVGEVAVTIKDGRVQETNLPAGTIVNTAGGQFQINGATNSGYTSTPYTGSYTPKTTVNTNTISKPVTYQPTNYDVNNFNQPNNDYLLQMQDYYNKQMQAFQQQLQSQEDLRLKQYETDNLKIKQNNAYQTRNQQNINNTVQGTVGNYHTPQVQSYAKPQGAHIKKNNASSGAISRYLAQDIWKDK